MDIKVMYHSSTGNTKKLADAIAASFNISAEAIDESTPASTCKADLLFIGDGIYAGKPNKHTVAFIEGLDPLLVKNAAVFATYGGQDSIGRDIQQLLKNRGINVLEPAFACKGKSWWLINRKHPSAADLDNLREFVKSATIKIIE